MKNTPAGVSPAHAKAISRALKKLFYSASQIRNDSSVVGNSVREALNSLKTSLSAISTPGTWTTLSLTSGLTATTGTYTPACRLFNSDTVELSGGITGTIASGTTITTLPSGFRPASQVVVLGADNGAGAVRITINTSGTVVVTAPSSVGGMSLGGITFRLT